MSATSSVSSSSSNFYSSENPYNHNLQTKEGRNRFYHRLVTENLNDEIVSSFIQICDLRSKINLKNEFFSYLQSHHIVDESLKFISKFDELRKNVLRISQARGLNCDDEQDLLKGIEDLENGLYDARPDVHIIVEHNKTLEQLGKQGEALARIEENLTTQNETIAKQGEDLVEIKVQVAKNEERIAKIGEALVGIQEESKDLSKETEDLSRKTKDLRDKQDEMIAKVMDLAQQNQEMDARMTAHLKRGREEINELQAQLATLTTQSLERNHIEITIPEENPKSKIKQKPGLKERIKLLKITPNYEVFRDFYSRHQPLIKNICLGVLLLFIVGGITTGIYFKIYV